MTYLITGVRPLGGEPADVLIDGESIAAMGAPGTLDALA